MRRIILMLTVAAFMVAMMALTAAPGFAQSELPEQACDNLVYNPLYDWYECAVIVPTPPERQRLW